MCNFNEIYLFMDVYKTLNYFTKQLPHSADIVTEASVNVVSQRTLLTEFHLHVTSRIFNVKRNQIIKT